MYRSGPNFEFGEKRVPKWYLPKWSCTELALTRHYSLNVSLAQWYTSPGQCCRKASVCPSVCPSVDPYVISCSSMEITQLKIASNCFVAWYEPNHSRFVTTKPFRN